jgi:hypothetical protein
VDDLGRELAAVLADAEAGFLAGLDPGGVALGDAEPEEERVAADERRQDGAGLYWPVWTVRVWMTPEMGALTKASRRSSLAWLRAERFSATSEAAVRTFVRQVSTSSPGMRPGFCVVTVSRRLSPASASAFEASAFS